MNKTFEGVVNAALALAALAIGAGVAYRTIVPSVDAAVPSAIAEADTIEGWAAGIAAGMRVGDAKAPVTIIELTDFECPACRRFQPVLDKVLAENKGRLSVVYVNHPLSQHRFAMAAARAAECAAQLGSLAEWIEAVYASQDSLGLRSWGSFAAAAGIGDTAAVAQCAGQPTMTQGIKAGLEFGRTIGLQGTPTILVNGWRFNGVPTYERLNDIVGRLARGEAPFAR